jgi:SET domain-containing protein
MCDVPQQDTANTTDCGVFVCMYCDVILNDCKLDFKQHNITNSDWKDRMILSILSVEPTNDKEKNNNDEVTLSAINMKWNNKQKNIARSSAWSTNLIIKKDCKANKDEKMDCNDDCNDGLDCKNKTVKKCLWKKVEVRHTKDGKGSNLFAMEDIDKDDYVIEYLGKIEYNRRENNCMMKINGMNLWINGDKNGGPARYMNHSCDPNCVCVLSDLRYKA